MFVRKLTKLSLVQTEVKWVSNIPSIGWNSSNWNTRSSTNEYKTPKSDLYKLVEAYKMKQTRYMKFVGY